MNRHLPAIATESIPLSVSATVPVSINHGLGRPIEGWLVIYQSAPCQFSIQDPAADSSQVLVLVPSATASVRLVLL